MASVSSKLNNDNISLTVRSPDVKVQIVPNQQKKLAHIAKREKVDLSFSNLSFTVKQGKREYYYYYYIVRIK